MCESLPKTLYAFDKPFDCLLLLFWLSSSRAALSVRRERQEKAANKVRAAAEAKWRNLLRSIFTRIKVQGDYAEDAVADQADHTPGTRLNRPNSSHACDICGLRTL